MSQLPANVVYTRITKLPILGMQPHHPMFGKPQRQKWCIEGFDVDRKKVIGMITGNKQKVEMAATKEKF